MSLRIFLHFSTPAGAKAIFVNHMTISLSRILRPGSLLSSSLVNDDFGQYTLWSACDQSGDFRSDVAKKRDVTFHHVDVSKSNARVLGEWKTLSEETLIWVHIFSTLLSMRFLWLIRRICFTIRTSFTRWQGDYFLQYSGRISDILKRNDMLVNYQESVQSSWEDDLGFFNFIHSIKRTSVECVLDLPTNWLFWATNFLKRGRGAKKSTVIPPGRWPN